MRLSRSSRRILKWSVVLGGALGLGLGLFFAAIVVSVSAYPDEDPVGGWLVAGLIAAGFGLGLFVGGFVGFVCVGVRRAHARMGRQRS